MKTTRLPARQRRARKTLRGRRALFTKSSVNGSTAQRGGAASEGIDRSCTTWTCCSVLPPMKDLFESEKFESEKFVFRVAGVFTGVCVADQRLFSQPDTPDDCGSGSNRSPDLTHLETQTTRPHDPTRYPLRKLTRPQRADLC